MIAATFFLLFVVVAGDKSQIPAATVPWIMCFLALAEPFFWWAVYNREFKERLEKEKEGWEKNVH